MNTLYSSEFVISTIAYCWPGAKYVGAGNVKLVTALASSDTLIELGNSQVLAPEIVSVVDG